MRKWIFLSLFIIFLFPFLGGLGPAAENVVRIGSLLPLTGPAASMGQEMQRGQLLAKEYWNSNQKKHGTLRIDLTIEDSKSSPKDAVTGYMKLRSQGISIFTANLSSVSLALLPKVKEEDVLLFADAAHPAITHEPHPMVFRNSSTSELEAQEISRSLKEQGVKSISVLVISDEYGIVFVKELREHLNNVMVKETPFDVRTAEFRVLALKALQAKPDAVVIVGIGKSIGSLILALREQGFDGKIYANIGYLLTGGREAAGSSGKGIYYTRMKVPLSEPGKWAEGEYKKRFGKPMPAEALLEFNTISLLALASRGTQPNPLAISKNMLGAVDELIGADRLNTKGDILPDMEVLVDTGD